MPKAKKAVKASIDPELLNLLGGKASQLLDAAVDVMRFELERDKAKQAQKESGKGNLRHQAQIDALLVTMNGITQQMVELMETGKIDDEICKPEYGEASEVERNEDEKKYKRLQAMYKQLDDMLENLIKGSGEYL